MKFFYDTEFIEDGQTIDLISIGIVAENGDSYYAISTEFKARRASQWVKDNVLIHLPERNPRPPPQCSPSKWIQSRAWKSREQIANEIRQFVQSFPPPHEFWAYYGDYDHVVLCQLFGTMMDLPEDFPMYTRDLKQLCDSVGNPNLPEEGKNEHHALADARWNKRVYDFLCNGNQTERRVGEKDRRGPWLAQWCLREQRGASSPADRRALVHTDRQIPI